MSDLAASSRRHWGPILGLAALAFALRLLAAALLPGSIARSDDARAYRDLAVNLVTLHRYVSAVDPPHDIEAVRVDRPPLVPLSLAAVFALFGPGDWSERFFLALLGALACAAVYSLGRELFGHPVGLTAAAVTALYPFFLVLAAIPLTESFNILLYPLLALLIVRLRRRRQLRHAVLAGAVIGISALGKAVILAFLPVLALCLLPAEPGERPRWRAAAQHAMAMGLTAAAVIAPWTARNYMAVGGFVPVHLQMGSVLNQGSGPYADYPIRLLEEGRAVGWINAPEFYATAPEHPDQIVRDRLEIRMALEHVRRHPGQFVGLAWRKQKLFWGTYAHPVHALSWAVVAVLALAGLVLTRRQWRELLPLYVLIGLTALVPVLFTSMPRFRAPIEPLLIVFAGAAAVAAWALLRRRPGILHSLRGSWERGLPARMSGSWERGHPCPHVGAGKDARAPSPHGGAGKDARAPRKRGIAVAGFN